MVSSPNFTITFTFEKKFLSYLYQPKTDNGNHSIKKNLVITATHGRK